MKVLKQVLGIDVAQKELVVTLGSMFTNLRSELYAHKVFKNSESGFSALLKWVNKLTDATVPVRFVMEATGVYHEKFAYYLAAQSQDVSIVLPNKISNYMRTLDTKTITDKTCSEAIAQFGIERNLEQWKRPDSTLKVLKQLTRERDQIVSERVVIKNQIHAEASESEPNKNSIKRLRARLALLNKQEKEIKQEIDQRIEKNKALKDRVQIITSIPGVGQLTAAIVLAETNGFELIRNKKQLTSYAGLDVKEKQSGTSVKGKPRISKKGNRHLRKAMHLPALCAIKREDRYKDTFARLVATHGIKMKAVVAIQRKLLELIYVLDKNHTTYDKGYEKKEREQQVMLTPS